MRVIVVFVLCSLAVSVAWGEVTLASDKISETVAVSATVKLECCFGPENKEVFWVMYHQNNITRNSENWEKGVSSKEQSQKEKLFCGTLTIKHADLKDTGFYQCWLEHYRVYTHGTYLRVYKPLAKTINISESTKNKILTAEGVLLLLCVLLPSATLLFKSKKLNDLEKKKAKKEEENIYQGLNLDDCCATYDQIERSQGQGPYQDVGNIKEEEEEIQLEKP